ncbi:hypothetical protein QP166_16740 [Sphingomonas sp. LR60]|uniref:EF-hand domain-containing protein n=1 Tax=Sphingomonas sp. LR60 TaxID=3050233 RepID=UPI002FDF9448
MRGPLRARAREGNRLAARPPPLADPFSARQRGGRQGREHEASCHPLPTLAAALVAFLSLPALTATVLAQETRASATAKLDKEFAASDANKDGFLSPAEIEARMRKMKVGSGKTLDATHAKRVAALFLARADTNKDGKVSKRESDALMGAVFNAYDTNKDGKVDATEAARARAAAGGAAQGKATPKR